MLSFRPELLVSLALKPSSFGGPRRRRCTLGISKRIYVKGWEKEGDRSETREKAEEITTM